MKKKIVFLLIGFVFLAVAIVACYTNNKSTNGNYSVTSATEKPQVHRPLDLSGVRTQEDFKRAMEASGVKKVADGKSDMILTIQLEGK